ncbi:hypothetical protein BGZ47_007017 [Haplosporangium gracile]|nr:hypothetical protein BGZ47_007017 [Haplosporangium gracile]
MKIITLSAVLCLAATTVLADKKSTVASSLITDNHDLSIAASVADQREARHHEINGASVVKLADEPKGVNRHESQGKKGRKHNEHGLEAHSDGGDRYQGNGDEGDVGGNGENDYHNTDEEKEMDVEKEMDAEKEMDVEKDMDAEKDMDVEKEMDMEKGSKGDEMNGGGGGKKNDEEKEDEVSEDKKEAKGDKKGAQGGKKGAQGDKKGAQGDKKGAQGGKKGVKGDKKGAKGAKKGAKGAKKGDNAGDNKEGADDKNASDKTEGEKNPTTGTGGDAAKPATGADDKQATTTPAADEEDKEGDAGATNPSVSRDYASPLWLVQPVGSSVWAQGMTYVISWGPNPEPVYAKALSPKSSVDILLMQGPNDNLKEIAVLSKDVDSSVHMLEWLIPTTVAPATDYSIRITHAGDVDTYSHYFEVVKAGDPRSNKSNVGEPLQMPQKGDMPQLLNKDPIMPASPPNPVPAAPAASKPVFIPAVAKPAGHASSAHSETRQGANMLAFAMTLLGAVYFM